MNTITPEHNAATLGVTFGYKDGRDPANQFQLAMLFPETEKGPNPQTAYELGLKLGAWALEREQSEVTSTFEETR